jgi:hypothetical protein
MSRMPRKRPCASCPYRKDVPSGVWAESEYEKLPQYDGEIHEQIEKGALATFGCHQADGHLCAGWTGHRDPSELLAVRLAVNAGHIPEAVLDYTTDVPLWSSGQEAAEHGMAEIDAPSEKADRIINKLLTNVPGVTLG